MGTGRPLGSVGEREIELGYAHTFELGGKRARRIDVGRVGVEIAELIVADRERQLIAEVKARYAEVLAAERNLRVLNDLWELTDRSYRAAQHRVAEGEAAPVERALLQATQPSEIAGIRRPPPRRAGYGSRSLVRARWVISEAAPEARRKLAKPAVIDRVP